jgi:hypothetical protein
LPWKGISDEMLSTPNIGDLMDEALRQVSVFGFDYLEEGRFSTAKKCWEVNQYVCIIFIPLIPDRAKNKKTKM